MIQTLISFITASAILAISPGPDNIFVLTQGIVNGKKYGLATVAGLMTGCLVHTTLVAFGVSGIIQQNENIFMLIKLFGAGYLLYLAYKVYRSDASISFSTQGISQQSAYKLYQKGFLMNVLNPKVTIFFLAFFPQFLFSDSISSVLQFYLLGGLFILTSGSIFSIIALLAGRIADYIKSNSKVGIYLKWLQIVVFITIAVMILR